MVTVEENFVLSLRMMQGWCIPERCVPDRKFLDVPPLNKVSLGYCAPDRCVPTLDHIKHGTSSVGRYCGLGRPPAPNGSVGRLAGFAYAPDQVYWLAPLRRMHARPTHRIKSKGWDGSVRGKIAKGHFVQGMQHPRIFGRGHIGRGWTNIAPLIWQAGIIWQDTHSTVHLNTQEVLRTAQ